MTFRHLCHVLLGGLEHLAHLFMSIRDVRVNELRNYVPFSKTRTDAVYCVALALVISRDGRITNCCGIYKW